MMLDLSALPKNQNGFRTTHTCELCGFEPKTKNKYREKQDHLVMKHFKEKIDKIFPHCRPYTCPTGCGFTGKDKQALLRHYTGKHGILEKYLREALAEKGINYSPNENGKRRHSEMNGNGRATNGSHAHKNPRLSLSPPGGIVQTNIAYENGVETGGNIITTAKPVTVVARQNTEELRKEVEAMMRSFQPVEQPVVIQNISTVGPAATKPSTTIQTISRVTSDSAGAVSSPTTVLPIASLEDNGGKLPSISSIQMPATSLPSIVLSAVANATAASMAASNSGQASSNMVNGRVMTVSLPTQPANVPTITVSANQPNLQSSQIPSVIVSKTSAVEAAVASSSSSPSSNSVIPSASVLPLPIQVITNGPAVDSIVMNGGSSGGSSIGGSSATESTSPSPVVENEDVMWSAASTNNGPAVVVEAAHSLPVPYIDTVNFSANSIEQVEYDLLYPVANTVTASNEVRERQLDFCML